jgi:hypothetical protein
MLQREFAWTSAKAGTRRPASGVLPVGTTDLWKTAGVLLFLVDHWGLFFAEHDAWWAVFGRLAAPIFFFLIGFARTRSVPWSWIALGLLLTVSDVLTGEDDEGLTLNILLSFALIRLALPAIELRVMPHPGRVSLLVLVLVLLIPVTSSLEYGSEGWLFALFGLAHRLHREQGDDDSARLRSALALVSGGVYVWREVVDYGFTLPQAGTLAVLILGLVLLLCRFRRAALDTSLPSPVAKALRLCGHHSLEIYAVTLLSMQILAYGLMD